MLTAVLALLPLLLLCTGTIWYHYHGQNIPSVARMVPKVVAWCFAIFFYLALLVGLAEWSNGHFAEVSRAGSWIVISGYCVLATIFMYYLWLLFRVLGRLSRFVWYALVSVAVSVMSGWISGACTLGALALFEVAITLRRLTDLTEARNDANQSREPTT